jgi:glycosyltransferase involved in cell wall biosynthesis
MREQGGVQVHVHTLESELRRRGHNVVMFPVPPLHLEMVDARLIFYIIEQSFYLLWGILRVFNSVKKEHVQIVHVHGARLPLILGFFVTKIMKIPLVVTIHEAWTRANKLNRQYKFADRVISVSHESEAVLRSYGLDWNKLTCIPNMVDEVPPELHRISGNNNHNITFVGRLDPSKTGILEILLDAAPRIIRRFPHIQISVIGSHGQSYADVRTRVEAVNISLGENIVELLGYVRNPFKMLQKADVVIGVGRIALEAMSCGKPVIVGSSSNGRVFTGGLVTGDNATELEKHNFTGRSFSKRVDAQQMADIIISILENEDYRTELGEFGREFIQRRFATSLVVDNIVSVYLDCLNRDTISHR